MAAKVEFFLDFMSPFAYLAHHRLQKMQKEFGFELLYHAIDLPYVKTAVGNTGPTNRSIPAKIAYLTEDLQRWARIYGIPLVTPASHDSKLANTGMLVANERGCPTEYANEVWKRTWGAGGDFASFDLLREVAEALGWDGREFEREIQAPQRIEAYQRSSDDAVRRGVFGVPIMIADGNMWWGNDRLNFLQKYLSGN